MAQILTVYLEHDSDTDNPIGNSGDAREKFVSFRDVKPDEYFRWSDKHNSWIMPIGLRRQIATKTAFMLSYYEHSLCRWSLTGEGPQGQWDTVPFAGIYWVPTDVPTEKRESYARAALEEYTEWCNGSCYYYRIEDQNENEINSCGGYIGSDYFMEEVKKVLEDYMSSHEVEEIVYTGDSTWMTDRYDLPIGTG